MLQEASTFQFKSTQSTLLQAEEVYTQDESICGQSEDFTSSDDSLCWQVRIEHVQAESKIPKTSHFITSLAYKLKLHHKRNQYLRARLDTCTDENIMPVSFYKLVFCGPDLKKLVPSRLEIGTYATNSVKLIGPLPFIWCSQIPSVYRKWHSMLQQQWKHFVILCHHACTWVDTISH